MFLMWPTWRICCYSGFLGVSFHICIFIFSKLEMHYLTQVCCRVSPEKFTAGCRLGVWFSEGLLAELFNFRTLTFFEKDGGLPVEYCFFRFKPEHFIRLEELPRLPLLLRLAELGFDGGEKMSRVANVGFCLRNTELYFEVSGNLMGLTGLPIGSN